MQIHEFLPLYLGGVHEVIDVTHKDVNLRRHLQLPEAVHYRRHDLEEAEKLDLGPGSLVFSLLGAHPPVHSEPDALAPLLRRLEPGARGLLLIGWPIEELPYHRLLGPLVAGRCQVIEAVPLDRVAIRGVYCALVIERVEKLAPPRSYLIDVRTGSVRDNESAAEAPDELRTALRVMNEHILGDLVARPMRRRLIELAQQLEEQNRLLTERDGQLRGLEKRLATLQSKLARVESSASFQVGRAFVQGVRHPARAVVTVPRDLARVWQIRRSKKEAPPSAVQSSAPPTTRVVSIALPATTPGTESMPGRPELLTLTAPSDSLVPRKLAKEGLAGYETEALACFLAATDVAGPGAVLDIGANVGIYAALASSLTEREVRAFEPAPSLVELARRFAVDNDLGYTTESLALGAENGSAIFYLSDSSDTSNSLAAGFRKSSAQIEVPVETLDSYVARTGVVPAVMKVDTEITEPDIIAGGVKTITKHRPWILCEVLAGRVETRLTEVLAPFGYHWYHVTDEIPYQETKEIVGDRTYQNLMWLFAPERPGDDFWSALGDRVAALRECTPARAGELRARGSASV